MKRRTFLYESSKLAGGAALASMLPTSRIFGKTSTIAPSDKIRIGAIGVKGMGSSLIKSMMKKPEIEIVALCDVIKRFWTIETVKSIKQRVKQCPHTAISENYWTIKTSTQSLLLRPIIGMHFR